MPWYMRVALCLAVGSAFGAAAPPPKLPVRTKVKVDLRWVETRRIEGLTEDKGFQASCDPKDVVYPHKKPALVLTAAEVTEARLFTLNISGSNHYRVALPLTKQARDKLAATCKGKEMRLLTVVVDGKYWGVSRYEKDKDKPFVPPDARAETFLPSVGYFSSKAEAQRLVDAFQ